MDLQIDTSAGEPTRDAIDALPGPTLLEFGSPWCGHCRAAKPLIASALSARPGVRHVKVEDGRGRPLGRSFGVKLWPTLVFLRDGKSEAQMSRPDEKQMVDAFEALAK